MSDKFDEFATRFAEFQIETQQRFQELENKIEEIESDENETEKDHTKEVEGFKILGPDGVGAGSPEISEIIRRSKIGNGIKVGEAETLLETNNRKKTLRIMRHIAKEHSLKFKQGRGNNPSMLKFIER